MKNGVLCDYICSELIAGVYYSICQIFWKKYRDVSEIQLEYVRYFGKNIGMTLKYNQG